MAEHRVEYQNPLVGVVLGWLISASVCGILVFDLFAAEQKTMGETNAAAQSDIGSKTEKLRKELRAKEQQLERLTIRTASLRELKRGEARWIDFGDARADGRNDGPNPDLSGTFLKLAKTFPAQKPMIEATRKKMSDLEQRIIGSQQPQQIRQLKDLGTKELAELVVVLSRVP